MNLLCELVKKILDVISSFSLESMYMLLLLMCCAWIVVGMMNADNCGEMGMIKNMVPVIIFVMQFFVMI